MKPRMGIPMHPDAFRRTHPEAQAAGDNEVHEQWKKIDSKEQYKKYWETLKSREPVNARLLKSPDYRKSMLERTAQFVVKVHELKPDTIVCMETRARVLGVLIKKVWERLYPDEKCPEVRFLIPNKTKDEKRKEVYLSNLKNTFDGNKDAFSNKKVLLVDEVVGSGTTISNASEDLKKVFPDANIYWGGFSGQEPYLFPDKKLDIAPVDNMLHPFYESNEQIKICGEVERRQGVYPGGNDRTDAFVTNIDRGPLAGYDMQTQKSAGNGVVPGRVSNDWPSASLNSRMSVLAEYEMLDEKSLHSVENAEIYSRENNAADNLKYLTRVREAYQKLTADTFDRQK